MLNKFQGRIYGESFREVNRRRRSRRGIRENFHRLSGPGRIGMTMVASLCKCHSGQTPFIYHTDQIDQIDLTVICPLYSCSVAAKMY